MALLVDPNASAYEFLFSFASPEEKDQFLDLVRSNEDRESFYFATAEEIRDARPLATVLPQDVFTHATLIAATTLAGAEDDRAAS